MKILLRKPDFEVRDYGLVDYRQGLCIQSKLLDAVKSGKSPNTIIVLEHNPVITLGANETENRLLTDESLLLKSGIELCRTGRGGGATAHNPGQLVIYPIVNLRSIALNVHEYIRKLESIGMKLLKRNAVTASRRKGLPGLWVNEKKIASIGVRITGGITHHGMAINLSNDISIFDNIVPCGIEGVQMSSIQLLTGLKPDRDAVIEMLGNILTEEFSPFSEVV